MLHQPPAHPAHARGVAGSTARPQGGAEGMRAVTARWQLGAPGQCVQGQSTPGPRPGGLRGSLQVASEAKRSVGWGCGRARVDCPCTCPEPPAASRQHTQAPRGARHRQVAAGPYPYWASRGASSRCLAAPRAGEREREHRQLAQSAVPSGPTRATCGPGQEAVPCAGPAGPPHQGGHQNPHSPSTPLCCS